MHSTPRCLLVLLAALHGCGDGTDPLDTGTRDAGGKTDGGDARDGGRLLDAGDDAGSGSDTGLSPDSGVSTYCPSDELGSELPLVYEGDTTDAPNLMESPRFSLSGDPDHALRWTVPDTGTYRFTLPVGPSGTGACLVAMSDWDGNLIPPSACPARGEKVELDLGWVAVDDPNSPSKEATMDLDEGTEMLLFVSCAEWSPIRSGPYRIRIERL